MLLAHLCELRADWSPDETHCDVVNSRLIWQTRDSKRAETQAVHKLIGAGGVDGLPGSSPILWRLG